MDTGFKDQSRRLSVCPFDKVELTYHQVNPAPWGHDHSHVFAFFRQQLNFPTFKSSGLSIHLPESTHFPTICKFNARLWKLSNAANINRLQKQVHFVGADMKASHSLCSNQFSFKNPCATMLQHKITKWQYTFLNCMHSTWCYTPTHRVSQMCDGALPSRALEITCVLKTAQLFYCCQVKKKRKHRQR